MNRALSRALFAALVMVACGRGEAPPPKVAEAPEEPSGADDRQPIEVTGEIGGLSESQVNRSFEHALRGLKRCLDEGARKVEYLGGDVGFLVEVDRSGTTRVSVEQSTLGDRATEKCMLGVLKAETWPKPVGGEKGEARKSFSFDPPRPVRPPVEWSADDLREEVNKLAARVEQCKHGHAGGAFTATIYVDPSGQALAAGVTAPNADADAVADCIVGVLMSAKYHSPGSWAAKASFQL